MRGISVAAFAVSLLIPISADAMVRDIIFPVSGQFSFRDDFREPRDGGAREHLGIDIIAPKMTPLVSVVDGIITFMTIPQASWGYAMTIQDSEGYTYRYLHLNNDTPGTDDGQGGTLNAFAPGITRGMSVTRGQLLGWVGDSGNAESTVSHLHFEMRDASRTVINPYESLRKASGYSLAGVASTTVEHAPEKAPGDEEFIIYYRNYYEGTIHPDVIIIHESLTRLGYYTGEIKDTFDSVTREAVRKFQSDRGIQANGIADALTMKTMREAAKVTTTITPTSSSLSEGSSGQGVTDVQIKLKALGYLSATPTGYFGPLTKAAVIAFQKNNGVDPIGIVGPATRAALSSPTAKSASAVTSQPATNQPAPPIQSPQLAVNADEDPPGGPFVYTAYLELGSEGVEVRALQEKLAELGFFFATPTGYFGTVTEASVKKFQESNGLEPVGIVGPRTREKLNAL